MQQGHPSQTVIDSVSSVKPSKASQSSPHEAEGGQWAACCKVNLHRGGRTAQPPSTALCSATKIRRAFSLPAAQSSPVTLGSQQLSSTCLWSPGCAKPGCVLLLVKSVCHPLQKMRICIVCLKSEVLQMQMKLI